MAGDNYSSYGSDDDSFTQLIILSHFSWDSKIIHTKILLHDLYLALNAKLEMRHLEVDACNIPKRKKKGGGR